MRPAAGHFRPTGRAKLAATAGVPSPAYDHNCACAVLAVRRPMRPPDRLTSRHGSASMSTKSVPSSDVEQTQVAGGPSLACRQAGGQTPADQAVVKIGTGVGTPFRVAKPSSGCASKLRTSSLLYGLAKLRRRSPAAHEGWLDASTFERSALHPRPGCCPGSGLLTAVDRDRSGDDRPAPC